MDVQTVSKAMVSFMEARGVGVPGTDIYVSQVPKDANQAVYWLITSGGSPIQKNRTGEKIKQYFVSIYYRSTRAQDVDENLFSLEELLNDASCVELPGFEVVEIECTQFPSDFDVDNEERRVGFLQANIKIYKKES